MSKISTQSFIVCKALCLQLWMDRPYIQIFAVLCWAGFVLSQILIVTSNGRILFAFSRYLIPFTQLTVKVALVFLGRVKRGQAMREKEFKLLKLSPLAYCTVMSSFFLMAFFPFLLIPLSKYVFYYKESAPVSKEHPWNTSDYQEYCKEVFGLQIVLVLTKVNSTLLMFLTNSISYPLELAALAICLASYFFVDIYQFFYSNHQFFDYYLVLGSIFPTLFDWLINYSISAPSAQYSSFFIITTIQFIIYFCAYCQIQSSKLHLKQIQTVRRNHGPSCYSICAMHQYNRKATALAQDSTFTFKVNQISLIIGPNGSGKSTLFKILAQLITPTKGKFKYYSSGPQQSSMSNLCSFYNPECLIFNMFITVEENIELLYSCCDGLFSDEVTRIFGLFNYNYEAMRKVRVLTSSQFNNLESLSKLSLAMVLLQNFRVLLLDEPFQFLKEVEKNRVLLYLESIKHRRTIIICTHNLTSMPRFSDQIFLLSYGHILKSGSPQQIFGNLLHYVKVEVILNESPKNLSEIKSKLLENQDINLKSFQAPLACFYTHIAHFQEIYLDILGLSQQAYFKVKSQPLEYFLLSEMKKNEDINLLQLYNFSQELIKQQEASQQFYNELLAQKQSRKRKQSHSLVQAVKLFCKIILLEAKFTIFAFFFLLSLLNIMQMFTFYLNSLHLKSEYGFYTKPDCSQNFIILPIYYLFSIILSALLFPSALSLLIKISSPRVLLVSDFLKMETCLFLVQILFTLMVNPTWQWDFLNYSSYLLESIKCFQFFHLMIACFTFKKGRIIAVPLILASISSCVCALYFIQRIGLSVSTKILGIFPGASQFIIAWHYGSNYQNRDQLMLIYLGSAIFYSLLLFFLLNSKLTVKIESCSSSQYLLEDKEYLHKVACSNQHFSLSFQLQKGELCEIIANSAQIRARILKILTLHQSNTIDHIQYFNQAGKDMLHAFEKIGTCLQNQTPFKEDLTVTQNLELLGFAKSMNKETISQHLIYFVEEFRMLDYRDTKAQHLSSGNRQKLKCIMTLFDLPELLILESPTEGFDYFSVQNFNRLIKTVRDNGTCVIMVNIRPSELVYSASQFLYYSDNQCLVRQPGIDFIKRVEQTMVLKVTPKYQDQIPELFSRLKELVNVRKHWTVNNSINCLIQRVDSEDYIEVVHTLGEALRTKRILEFEVGFLGIEDMIFLQEQGVLDVSTQWMSQKQNKEEISSLELVPAQTQDISLLK